MNKERLLALMADYLAREITQAKQEELQELISSDPELALQAQQLQGLWELMDKAFPTDEGNSQVLQKVLHRILSENKDDKLSEEDLDKAAGGIYKQRYDQDPYKK